MQKLHFIILLNYLLAGSMLMAEDFDKTKNYQGNNAMAYKGQYLIVPPIDQKSMCQYYSRFKINSFTTKDGNFDINFIYRASKKFEIDALRLGTAPEDLALKMFRVTDVELMQDCKSEWLFSLENVDDQYDCCKYVYNGSLKYVDDHLDFPFYVIEYMQYVYDKYVNNEVIIATRDFYTEGQYIRHHKVDHRDFFTQDSITFYAEYDKFLVKDMYIDTLDGDLKFLLANDYHSFGCSTNLLYERLPLYNHLSSKVFTIAEWEQLCAQYGKAHMEAIICGITFDGMTLDEVHMALGTQTSIDHKEGWDEYTWYIKENDTSLTYKIYAGTNICTESRQIDAMLFIYESAEELGEVVGEVIEKEVIPAYQEAEQETLGIIDKIKNIIKRFLKGFFQAKK